jgi:hypothetical protein
LLFATFLFEVVSFMSCYAGLPMHVGLPYQGGRLGLSIALNNGVCRPAPQPVPARETYYQPRGVLPRSQPRPAFPR